MYIRRYVCTYVRMCIHLILQIYIRICIYCFVRFGGWVVDGFPETREQWSVMLEQEVVPDHVLVLGEPEGKEGSLNERVKMLRKDESDKVCMQLHLWKTPSC